VDSIKKLAASQPISRRRDEVRVDISKCIRVSEGGTALEIAVENSVKVEV
jgi:hypothetical protein